MPQVISFAEKVSRKTADMVRWRKQLMWTYPIVNNQITAADLWLSRQPRLDLRTAFEILYRTIYAQALLYEHAHSPDNEECLLPLRRQYRMMQRQLPAPWCEAMAQIWAVWLDVFADEEEREEQADGAA